ncbi:MAG: phytanoyl-CoA dioxygenase [Rhodospirillaceae bacterium]|nr:phytanoyl-CoA dioxygenase [Rhodospirillaceae bacterium]
MGRRILSDDEVERYHRDGWVTPDYRLPDELYTEFKTVIEDLIASNPGIRPEQLVGAHVAGDRSSGIKGKPRLLELAQSPDLLDMVEQLIGPDVIMWGSQVFSKKSGDGLAIPWHQDGQYWPIRPLASVTVWIAIDASTVENGCLRVVPGSHRNGLLKHEVSGAADVALDQGLAAGTFDETTAADVELQPGQVSLHHVNVVHGSNPNHSTKRRCAYAIRYMPATSLFDRAIPPVRLAGNQTIDYSERPIWLVRGRDQAGNDFVRGH